MVTVIKPGNMKTVSCPECGAFLKYDASTDVLVDNKSSTALGIGGRYYTYIVCPQCKTNISLMVTR